MTDYKHSRPCESQIVATISVVFFVLAVAFLGIIGNMNIEHKQEIAQIKSTCGGNNESI